YDRCCREHIMVDITNSRCRNYISSSNNGYCSNTLLRCESKRVYSIRERLFSSGTNYVSVEISRRICQHINTRFTFVWKYFRRWRINRTHCRTGNNRCCRVYNFSTSDDGMASVQSIYRSNPSIYFHYVNDGIYVSESYRATTIKYNVIIKQGIYTRRNY